jgi:hypothetical protein
MYTRFRQTSLLFVIRDNITLKQTYCYHHFLKKALASNRGDIFKLNTSDKTAIRKSKEGDNNAIMLAGGPKLVEGELLPNNEEYRILQIINQQDNYYIVLEEVNNDNQESSSSSI